MATTDVSPLYVGDTGIVWHNTMMTKDGTIYPLTGLDPTTAFAMHWKNTLNNVVRVGNGTWTFPSTPGAAAQGLIDYALGSVDVGVAGIYKVYPIITTSNGPTHFDAQIIEVLSLT